MLFVRYHMLCYHRGALPRLAIDVGGERSASLLLPARASVGDTVKLTNEGEQGWRCDIVRPQKALPPARLVIYHDIYIVL